MKYQDGQIPQIIHQFWHSKDDSPPNKILHLISETWKEKNPSWEYRLWGSKSGEQLLYDNYPWFIDRYYNFRYDVQRWDAIRYLILCHFGGVYADMDYECLEPLDWLHGKSKCCLGLDPPEHNQIFNRPYIISNAFIAVIPQHPFFKCIIDEISSNNSQCLDKFNHVLETTGPFMLSNLYEHYQKKTQIWLIPSELISPISKHEVNMILNGKATEEITKKIEGAYAVHYFFGSWYSL